MLNREARAAVSKAFKARKVALRKGHWRVVHPEVVWYVGLRSAGPAPGSPLGFEIGAWLPALTPEPEGGAIDCPLLADVPLDVEGDVAAQVGALVDRMEAIADRAALSQAVLDGAFPAMFVDQLLREHLGV